MSDGEDVVALFAVLAAWPEGYRDGVFEGRRWGVSLTRAAGGAKATLFARELGGTDFVSANFYQLAAGAEARPCEMPLAKVARFVAEFVADDAAVNRACAI